MHYSNVLRLFLLPLLPLKYLQGFNHARVPLLPPLEQIVFVHEEQVDVYQEQKVECYIVDEVVDLA